MHQHTSQDRAPLDLSVLSVRGPQSTRGGTQPLEQEACRARGKWDGPFVLLTWEAVMGSGQAASVTVNMVAPLRAFNCHYVCGIRGVALDIEYECWELFARLHSCTVVLPHSATVTFLLKEGSF